ncbi:MAG: hypothetical protein SAK29_39575 [Scytonema sp. PMC 1069.18]|nr:hypothetical protein [Scytonema sp. PMC 1069.18]MEC4887308.1 hypothetical protein [Scytonema sp. PMC 1070.18]
MKQERLVIYGAGEAGSQLALLFSFAHSNNIGGIISQINYLDPEHTPKRKGVGTLDGAILEEYDYSL